jgi:predicted type IV restriction endonuclease
MDTRRIFILPLFDALGWDTTGNPDEVAEEVSGVAGRADYAFRIGGITRFLLEAKAIHVSRPPLMRRRPLSTRWSTNCTG